VLSGGAPTAPLMAGALAALDQKGKTFDIVVASGGGALIGLLFVAPRGRSPAQALRDFTEVGIADDIYRFLPIDFKAFRKRSPLLGPIHHWAQLFKIGIRSPQESEVVAPPQRPHGLNRLRRSYNDAVDMFAGLVTPSTVSYFSLGLCEPFPFIEDIIDFDRLKRFPGEFFMNAFNLTDHKMELFAKPEITLAHFKAALAYPFIYPPGLVKGKWYSEGALQEPITFGDLLSRPDRDEIGTVVLIDILGSLARHLIRKPRNIWDAYGISMLAPVAALAKRITSEFEAVHNTQGTFELLRLEFPIPPPIAETIMQWRYNNMIDLWKIGYETGLQFYERYHDRLPDLLPTS
jgi:NTE family protein